MEVSELKRAAAEAAAALVEPGMVIGLGHGSTADFYTRAVGRRLAAGSLHDIVAVPVSERTSGLARELDIPLTSLAEQPSIDLTVDGADEIDPQLDVIKGLGGALLREKVVACASRQLVIVADASKRVTRLGQRAPVPVEVIAFAQRPLTDYLSGLGARVELRHHPGPSGQGQPLVTDEGNVILDCYFGEIGDAAALAQAIRARPGVVEHGLFLGLADRAYVAGADGVVYMERS